MLLWLSYFGAGAMTSPAFVWGLHNAIQQSDRATTPAVFIHAALGIFTFAFTLYAAFRAFHIFTANQKIKNGG